VRVLTRDSRHLTTENCAEVWHFVQDCIVAMTGDIPVDRWVFDYEPIIQEWYSEWLRDDHYPFSPANRDDAQSLWDKFCMEVAA
jgi:hypothetical protein